LKIGIWIPRHYDTSVKIYVDNLRPYLEKLGVVFIEINENSNISDDIDMVWDPNCTGAKYPNRKIYFSEKKWIVTLHGASNFSLPLHYTFSTFKQKLFGLYKNTKRRIAWFLYKNRVAHVITVSKFAKQEIIDYLHIDDSKISVIYHGYNEDLFQPHSGLKPYLLSVSVYQKVKNVDRLIEAYAQIPLEKRMPLVVVCPNYPTQIQIEKLTLITQKISQKEVAKYMESAYCFVLPSIRESFGLPIIEAFACAVPVITSNTSALKEIAGDAGILVNPFSLDEIREAIIQITANQALRASLSRNASARAAAFSWEKSARLHFEVFRRVLED
jgi:glycosyltransferase involved in cell wall biosynthesis